MTVIGPWSEFASATTRDVIGPWSEFVSAAAVDVTGPWSDFVTADTADALEEWYTPRATALLQARMFGPQGDSP